MNEESTDPPRARRSRGGESITLVVNGFLAGAGSLYVVTTSVFVTAVVAGLAVALAMVLNKGNGRCR